ncbi:ABC transporter substrate-binding protein [Pseudodesulfovibrio senegalensis]|jgi:iron complex transport system substrate-binding protein|nr:ABC transporter substrate-binding protein [Pseudodesulfovibrio senegalensis]
MIRMRVAILFLVAILPIMVGEARAHTVVTDSVGRTIAVPKPFTRIISLYGAHTENICSLGRANALIGISRSDDYPAQITTRPRFNARDGIERFLAARPDLVLVRPMHWRAYPALWQGLEKAGVTVAALQPMGMKATYDYWRTLGTLTGARQQAESMVTNFKTRLADLKKATETIPMQQRPTVFFESIHRKLSTFSPDSTAMFALAAAGGINAAQDATPRHGTNIAEYGAERIIAHGADIDVYLAQTGTMNRTSSADIKQTPGFAAVKAVREGRVYTVSEDIVSRPTMRLLEGIATLRSLLRLPAKTEQ